MKWLVLIAALLVSFPAVAGWQPTLIYQVWDPALSRFGATQPQTDGGSGLSAQGDETANISVLGRVRVIPSGSKIRLRGFGAVLASPATIDGQCDLILIIDQVAQSWSEIRFGMNVAANSNCLNGGFPDFDLDTTGDSCYVPAPLPLAEFVGDGQSVNIAIGDSGDILVCDDLDEIDSIHWVVFVEYSETAP